jgi:hypothetical protein
MGVVTVTAFNVPVAAQVGITVGVSSFIGCMPGGNVPMTVGFSYLPGDVFRRRLPVMAGQA